jgi:hypothetical protein
MVLHLFSSLDFGTESPVVFDHLNTDAANEIIANIINIIISHFAISMEKPATPCAPNIYATKAITRNTIAALIKSTILTTHIPYYCTSVMTV